MWQILDLTSQPISDLQDSGFFGRRSLNPLVAIITERIPSEDCEKRYYPTNNSGTVLRLVLLGFGSVGQAFAKILLTRIGLLKETYFLEPRIVAIVDSSGAAVKQDGLDLRLALATKEDKGKISDYPKFGRPEISGVEILDEVDSDVAIEVTPTNIIDGEPGLSHIARAIDRGNHLITSNKGPLALAFDELVKSARDNGVEFRYTATVGGGTPIISLAKRCLAGNAVLSVRGILNGTTNYVLTRMTKEGLGMEEVLESARHLGLAEKDPSYDIDGIDTACKIVILANALIGRSATFKDVEEVTGIRGIAKEEVEEARARGFAIKLIGTADSSTLRVHPEPIPIGSPLCVDGTLNAIILETDLAKEITIIGRGAGPMETASTILNDLFDILRVTR